VNTEKLREIASYHAGTDLLGRMSQMLEWQAVQKKALDEAADEIDNLRVEIARLKEKA
jgi:polyhydroxyalkanoate synthesis regulator phasin